MSASPSTTLVTAAYKLPLSESRIAGIKNGEAGRNLAESCEERVESKSWEALTGGAYAESLETLNPLEEVRRDTTSCLRLASRRDFRVPVLFVGRPPSKKICLLDDD